MWRSKPKDNVPSNEAHHGQSTSTSARPSVESQRPEPDERTALLPQDHAPRLQPDDPAVSPYNLWSVRLLRSLTVIFTAISMLWFALLLVSIFVSPPSMNTRGSGFTDFSFTCLTLGLLLVSLLFFREPSQAMRISLLVVAVILLVDMIIIVAVERLRWEEGWVGIVSVVWAVLMALWCLMADRVVETGKHEEEERLTGRAETRRTLKEWLGVLVATVIMFVYILLAILMTATLILRSIDAGLAPDGDRYGVDGDKYEVHLACIGSQSQTTASSYPTVLLESGEDPVEYELENWAYEAFEAGIIPRYCYWDRPGYAWSDNAPSPHSAGMSADALSEALARANETGPWVSVSAGYGSVVARVFASRQMTSVSGLMMLDPLHEDLLYRLASPGAGFVDWGYGILSPLGIQRLAGALFQGRTKEDRVYGRSVSQSGKFLKAKLQENLVAGSLSKTEALTARAVPRGKLPLVIISSAIEVGKDSEWSTKQDDMAHYTDNLVAHDTVRGTPHEIWKTEHGRRVMDKRIKQLLAEAAKI